MSCLQLVEGYHCRILRYSSSARHQGRAPSFAQAVENEARQVVILGAGLGERWASRQRYLAE
jgi:O-methyltransferase involved in polyketide biosynthesis